MSIEDQIAAALDSRKAQQPFVNDLVSSWERLARLVDTLIAAAAALAREANAIRAPDGEHADLFANLDRYLGDRADWRNRASALAARLAERHLPSLGEVLKRLEEGPIPLSNRVPLMTRKDAVTTSSDLDWINDPMVGLDWWQGAPPEQPQRGPRTPSQAPPREEVPINPRFHSQPRSSAESHNEFSKDWEGSRYGCCLRG